MHRAQLDGVNVAVMSPRDRCSLKTDLSAMTKTKGAKHVLQMIAGDERQLVAEFAPLGSVVDFADELEFGGQSLSPCDRTQIMKQVGAGVEELAAVGLQHGDLHPRNVLVFSQSPIVCKLGDLGECRCGQTDPNELQILERELKSL